MDFAEKSRTLYLFRREDYDMKRIMKHRIIILLFALGILVPVYSISLLKKGSAIKWETEVAKFLMGLAMTAIVGGFIKLAFDEKVKREAKEINAGSSNSIKQVTPASTSNARPSAKYKS
jgi:hypothetical protein